MEAKVDLIKSTVLDKLQDGLTVKNLFAAWANRQALDIYQNAQEQRWMTEGESEGKRWEPLNTYYAEWKAKKYQSYPGSGRKMLIRTGQLFFQGMSTTGSLFKKLVGDNELTIRVEDPGYFSHVNRVRPFMNIWGADTTNAFSQSFSKYLIQGLKT